MDENIKWIIQAVVIPLLVGIVSVSVFVFNLTVAHLRKELKAEKDAREKEESDSEVKCEKCNADLKEKIEHNRKNIGKVFDQVETAQQKIAVIERTCELKHRWNGDERRK